MTEPVNAPLIIVELIEEQLLSPSAYSSSRGYPEDLDTETLNAEYEEYEDNFQPWRILVTSGGNHAALFRSTERYFNEADARHAAEIAFGSGSNVYLRQADHSDVELRLAAE